MLIYSLWMQGNSLKLCHGKFRLLDVRKKLLTEKSGQHWNKFPRKLVFKKVAAALYHVRRIDRQLTG